MYRRRLFTVAAFAGVLAVGSAGASQCGGFLDYSAPQKSGCASATTGSTTTTSVTTTTVAAPPVVGNTSDEMVSVTPSGAAPNYPDTFGGRGAITPDGRYVAFWSSATNLVPGDTNGLADVFVRDRVAGTTQRVSVKSDGSEITTADVAGTADPYEAASAEDVSADGRFVLFKSSARLVSCDTDGGVDLYRFDRQTGTLALVSMTAAGFGSGSTQIGNASMSADGRYVAFDSDSPTIVPSDSDTIAPAPTTTNPGPTIPSPFPPGRLPDVFIRDMVAGTTTLVSVGPNNAGASGYVPQITPDGRYVVFSATNMVPSFVDGEIVRYDRTTGTSELVDLDAAGQPAPGSFPSISADGNIVVFTHPGTNNAVPLTPDAQPDGGGYDEHLYARDISAATTTLVDANVPLVTTDREAFSGTSVSADGRYVAFTCWCQRVFAAGPNGGQHHLGAYRADLTTHDVIEADVNADGVVANGDSGATGPRGITADGSSIVVNSSGDNLVTGDVNNHADLFVIAPH
jgi:Tol biopolymer transport system component